jgi:signal transduction histidine kinase
MITAYDISVQYWYLNQDSVIRYASISKEYAEITKNQNYIAKALNSLGIGYLNKSDFRKSIQYFLDALKMNEKYGEDKNITANLNNIGTAYIRLEDYDKALEFLTKALDLSIKSNNKKQQDAILINIGDVYKSKGDLDKGLEFLIKSKNISEELKDELSLSEDLYNIGLNYYLRKNLDTAKYYYQESLSIKKRLGDNIGITYPLLGLAHLYYELNVYDSAFAFANDAYNSAVLSDAFMEISEASNILQILYAKQNNFQKAYEYLSIYNKYTDSIKSENMLRQIGRLETKYEFEKREKELKSERNSTIYSSIAVIIFLLLIGSLIYRSRAIQKNVNKILMAQNEEIKKQDLELKELNSQKDKFFSIIAHDLINPFHILLGISTTIIEEYDSMDDSTRLEHINLIRESSISGYQVLDNLLQWSRSRLKSLIAHPKNISITKIIRDEINNAKQSAESKNISLSLTDRFDLNYIVLADPAMMHVVIRNLITNAIKFTGKNGKIELSNSYKDELITTAISDDGIGIEDKVLSKLFRIDEQISTVGTEGESGSGLGLILCKEFVEKNNGKIWCNSTPGKGSTFYLSLPVKEY